MRVSRLPAAMFHHGIAWLYRIKAEIELIDPTKLKPGLGERIVTDLGARVAFGKVGGVCCNFIRDNPVLHVILVGETKVFLGGNVTEHGRAVPADHGRANCGCNVVVARGNICGQWAQRVEGASAQCFNCRSMFSLIRCMGTWPGPSIITCTSCFHAICVNSPRVISSANCVSGRRR